MSICFPKQENGIISEVQLQKNIPFLVLTQGNWHWLRFLPSIFTFKQCEKLVKRNRIVISTNHFCIKCDSFVHIVCLVVKEKSTIFSSSLQKFKEAQRGINSLLTVESQSEFRVLSLTLNPKPFTENQDSKRHLLDLSWHIYILWPEKQFHFSICLKSNFVKPNKILTHSNDSDTFHFHFFYWLTN